MNPKPTDLPTDSVIPPIKVKHHVNRRRMVVSGVIIAFMTFFATSALLLLFALMFAPQLSNALWQTDKTQQALYGTSAAVLNAQTIVDMTSTALANQASEQQRLVDSLTQEAAILDARESDLQATDEAITASIFATQTADVIVNEQQRTQAAIHYQETQLAINQQATRIAIEATSTQLALEDRPRATSTQDTRPFTLIDEVQYNTHPNEICNWQGIAGTITNLQGDPTGATVLQVHLLTTETDIVTRVGENLGLGDDYHWAVQVNDDLSVGTYFLRLESLEGDPLSPMIRVDFSASCTGNLAVIHFTQTQSLGD